MELSGSYPKNLCLPSHPWPQSSYGRETLRRRTTDALPSASGICPSGGYRHSMLPVAKSTFGTLISLTAPAESTTDQPS